MSHNRTLFALFFLLLTFLGFQNCSDQALRTFDEDILRGGSDLAEVELTAKKTLSPITIDGRLDESVWTLNNPIKRAISGTNDNSSSFCVLWDNTYFYIAIRVLDNVLKNDSNDAWYDDSIEVYLDPENNKSTSYDANDRQYIKGWNDPVLTSLLNSTGVLHATADIVGGYSVEMAIPWTTLNTVPASGKAIGFDVQQNDDDTGGDVQEPMGWHSTTGTNYKDTSAFGYLVLSATTVGNGGDNGSGSGGGDTTRPTIAISSPTPNATYTTTQATISISGIAADNVALSSVTCTISTGATCTATGSSNWTISNLSLSLGSNFVNITAKDLSNNTATATITVIREQDKPPLENQWQAVSIRTAAQKQAGWPGGEGAQQIWAMSYAPTNSKIAYLVTDTQGVSKSSDGGSTWERKSNGFKSNGGTSLTVSPYDENLVFVAGSPMAAGLASLGDSVKGIWRTTDGGENWQLVLKTYFDSLSGGGRDSFAFAGPSTIYAGTYRNGLVKSTDGGTNWTQIAVGSLGDHRIVEVAIHPDNSTILFLCDETTNQLYKVENESVITPMGSGLGGIPHHIVISGNRDGNPNNDIIFASRGSSIFRSTNSGLSFTKISNGLWFSTPINSLSMSPVDPNYLFVHAKQDNRIFFTHDGLSEVPTWVRASSGDEQNSQGDWLSGSLLGNSAAWEADYWLCPIAPHPSNRQVALAQGGTTNVTRTADGGVNWRIGISKAISAPAFKYRVSLCWSCFRIPDRVFQWKSGGPHWVHWKLG